VYNAHQWRPLVLSRQLGLLFFHEPLILSRQQVYNAHQWRPLVLSRQRGLHLFHGPLILSRQQVYNAHQWRPLVAIGVHCKPAVEKELVAHEKDAKPAHDEVQAAKSSNDKPKMPVVTELSPATKPPSEAAKLAAISSDVTLPLRFPLLLISEVYMLSDAENKRPLLKAKKPIPKE
ncbi:hypothetical protein KI387_007989, partial [Taxus chinensis]